jgi:hypothetical protein
MALKPIKASTEFHPTINGYSPWGPIVDIGRLADGIYRVTSQSHGGIWLSPARRAELTEKAPHLLAAAMVKSYCDKSYWWEEDVEAIIPLLVFWDELPAEMRRDTYYDYMVRTANSVYGLTLSTVAPDAAATA